MTPDSVVCVLGGRLLLLELVELAGGQHQGVRVTALDAAAGGWAAPEPVRPASLAYLPPAQRTAVVLNAQGQQ